MLQYFSREKTSKILMLTLITILISACGQETPPSVAVETESLPRIEVTNNPPSVTVPNKQFVNANDVVELTGQATDDVGVERVEWTQINGPTVVLSGANTNTVTFTAPALENGEEVWFRFKAYDAQNQTDSAGIRVAVNPVIENSIPLNVSIEDVEGIDLNDPENPLVIIAGRTVAPVSGSAAMSMGVDVKEENRVTILAEEDGTPLLMSYDGFTDGETELSIESSAVGFVLRNPEFYGVQITDFEELQKRIKAHPKFSKVTEKIQSKLSIGSPCPLKSSCNGVATRYASIIAEEIDLEGLVTAGK